MTHAQFQLLVEQNTQILKAVNTLSVRIEEVRQELKAEIQAVRKELKAEIQEVRKELKAEIKTVRKEAKADVEALRREMKADIETLRRETQTAIAAMGDTILDAMSEPFSTLESDFKTTKASQNKRLTRLEKRTA